MANGHGGSRSNSGRKSLAEEMGLPELIHDIVGDDGKKALIIKIAEQAKGGSFNHQQLLMAYMFGKPQDKVDITTGGDKLPESVKHTVIFEDYSQKE